VETDMPHWPGDVRPLAAGRLLEVLSTPRLVGIHSWAAWNGQDHAFAKHMGAIREAQGEDFDLYSSSSWRTGVSPDW
jgi:hypothetical protein